MNSNGKNSPVKFCMIRKNPSIKDIESAKKLIHFYEKLTESLKKKLNERQSEITDLWLTVKSIQAICKLNEESGIDLKTLKHIFLLTQRH